VSSACRSAQMNAGRQWPPRPFRLINWPMDDHLAV
jgi:hypothetical protein